jgi:hypothetical protein
LRAQQVEDVDLWADIETGREITVPVITPWRSSLRETWSSSEIASAGLRQRLNAHAVSDGQDRRLEWVSDRPVRGAWFHPVVPSGELGSLEDRTIDASVG